MRVLALICAVFAPVPALALSCMAPSVVDSYGRYEASEDIYVVVHGRLTLPEKKLPKGLSGDQNPPHMTRVLAKIGGKSLGKSGFTLPFEKDVTLEVACIGPWCGSVRNGEDVLAFLRKDAEGYALEVSPCGGAVFAVPKPAMIKQARQCMIRQNCGS